MWWGTQIRFVSLPGLSGSWPAPEVAAWDAKVHRYRGNLLLGDGSAQQLDNRRLKAQMSASTNLDVNNCMLGPWL